MTESTISENGSPVPDSGYTATVTKLSKLQRAVLLYALENRDKFVRADHEVWPGFRRRWAGCRLGAEELAAVAAENKERYTFGHDGIAEDRYDFDTEHFKCDFYGWVPAPRVKRLDAHGRPLRSWKKDYTNGGVFSAEQDTNGGVFSAEQVGEKRFRSVKSALSRCLARLEARGLLGNVQRHIATASPRRAWRHSDADP